MHIPRGELSPEELIKARKAEKRALYLRKIGKPIRITPQEFAECRARVNALHDQGMSYSEMAAQTGFVRHVFGHIANGRTKSAYRDTYEAILALRYTGPAGPEPHRGAYCDATGSVRRIDALRAVGFPLTFIAEQMGRQPQNIRYIRHGMRGIHPATRDRIAEVYDKLSFSHPREFGFSESVIKRMLTIARKEGFPPPGCWDADTIDDPDAFPEWTGACGTVHGRQVHMREKIPMCDPCRKAHAERAAELKEYTFDHARLVELMDRKHMSLAQMAEVLGMKPDTVSSFRTGHRRPTPETAEKIALYFKIDLTELTG